MNNTKLNSILNKLDAIGLAKDEVSSLYSLKGKSQVKKGIEDKSNEMIKSALKKGASSDKVTQTLLDDILKVLSDSNKDNTQVNKAILANAEIEINKHKSKLTEDDVAVLLKGLDLANKSNKVSQAKPESYYEAKAFTRTGYEAGKRFRNAREEGKGIGGSLLDSSKVGLKQMLGLLENDKILSMKGLAGIGRAGAVGALHVGGLATENPLFNMGAMGISKRGRRVYDAEKSMADGAGNAVEEKNAAIAAAHLEKTVGMLHDDVLDDGAGMPGSPVAGPRNNNSNSTNGGTSNGLDSSEVSLSQIADHTRSMSVALTSGQIGGLSMEGIGGNAIPVNIKEDALFETAAELQLQNDEERNKTLVNIRTILEEMKITDQQRLVWEQDRAHDASLERPDDQSGLITGTPILPSSEVAVEENNAMMNEIIGEFAGNFLARIVPAVIGGLTTAAAALGPALAVALVGYLAFQVGDFLNNKIDEFFGQKGGLGSWVYDKTHSDSDDIAVGGKDEMATQKRLLDSAVDVKSTEAALAEAKEFQKKQKDAAGVWTNDEEGKAQERTQLIVNALEKKLDKYTVAGAPLNKSVEGNVVPSSNMNIKQNSINPARDLELESESESKQQPKSRTDVIQSTKKAYDSSQSSNLGKIDRSLEESRRAEDKIVVNVPAPQSNQQTPSSGSVSNGGSVITTGDKEIFAHRLFDFY